MNRFFTAGPLKFKVALTRKTKIYAENSHFVDHSWDLPITVTVPDGVAAHNIIVSRGQVDLDPAGNVQNAGDWERQFGAVIENARQFFAAASRDFTSLARLTVYYVNDIPDRETWLHARLREHLSVSERPAVVMIPVPYYYFPDLVIECDFWGAQTGEVTRGGEAARYPGFPAVTRAGPLVFSSTMWPKDAGVDLKRQLHSIKMQILQALEDVGASFDDVVRLFSSYNDNDGAVTRSSLHKELANWFEGYAPVQTTLPVERKLTSTAGIDVIAVHPSVSGARRQVVRTFQDGSQMVEAVLRGGFLFTAGQLALDGRGAIETPNDLKAQTARCMERIKWLLESHALNFSDVFKATTFYRGRPIPADLFDNLLIRDSYYKNPGPASTGVPVRSLAPDGAMISTELIAALPDDAKEAGSAR